MGVFNLKILGNNFKMAFPNLFPRQNPLLMFPNPSKAKLKISPVPGKLERE